MGEECGICEKKDCLAEIIKISTLSDHGSIKYLTRFVSCCECGSTYASGMHLYLNKLEMLTAIKKQKALSEQSILSI